MKLLILSLLGFGLFAWIVFAKTEDGTSVAQPRVLYGTYNGGLVPVKVSSDGTLAIQ